MEFDPFAGAHHDVFIWTVGDFAFDDVDILDTEAFTGAKGGAGVMGLENIFEDDGEGEGTEIKDSFDLEALIFADELGQVIEEILVGGLLQRRVRVSWQESAGRDLFLNVTLHPSERISD